MPTPGATSGGVYAGTLGPMPGPSTTSMIAAAILCAAPEANPTPHPSKLVSSAPTPHPSKLVSANPTPHPYPVPVIDVLQVDDQLSIQLRPAATEAKAKPKPILTLPIRTGKHDTGYPVLEIAAGAEPHANKASPMLMTHGSSKLSDAISAKVELLAGHKVEGKLLLSIGCDGVVTDGSAKWRLEGPSSFVFPGGAQITLQPGPRGKAKACASVDVTGGDQKIHLTGSRSSVKVGEAVALEDSSLEYIELGRKVVTDNKHPDGAYFVKLAPASHKIEGAATSWLKMEMVEGKMQPTGVVLEGGNGVQQTGKLELQMGKIEVSHLIGEDG